MKQLAQDLPKFDVIVADPPWKAGSKNASRGVTLTYPTMSTKDILDLDMTQLQVSGWIFVWVVTKSYMPTVKRLEQQGYILIEEIVWLKYSKKGKLYKTHGKWLLRSKETCLVFEKQPCPKIQCATQPITDVLACLRRATSQKPDELYGLIEQLVPGGSYVELFARENNLRTKWTSIGNQVPRTKWSPSFTTSPTFNL